MRIHTDDVRIASVRPLLPAAILIEELPASEKAEETVVQTRRAIEASLSGQDRRVVVVVGPCSLHDEKAAMEYAELLKEQADRLSDDLVVVMRTYFEKPRTTVGWKGLVNDPGLDDSFRVNEGLRIARRILCRIGETGLACATEFLDTTLPQHYADLISWGAIGARTAESQTHREMASGLSMPIGFKNATDGRVKAAADGILAARHPHWFAGATKDGVSALIQTNGNDACHLILRGGESGPNYDAASILSASESLEAIGLAPRIMVDCSHGNSGKDYRRQPVVAASIAESIEAGLPVFGVMIESSLVEGSQPCRPRPELKYGVSITDSCIGWEQTVPLLESLATAARRSGARHSAV